MDLLFPFARGIVDDYLGVYQYYLWEDPTCASCIKDKVDDVLLASLPRTDDIRLMAFERDIMSIVCETPIGFIQSSLSQIMSLVFKIPFSVCAMKWLRCQLLHHVPLRTLYENFTMLYVQDAQGYEYMTQFLPEPIPDNDTILVDFQTRYGVTPLSLAIQHDNLEWFLELKGESQNNNFTFALIHRSIRIVAHINKTLKRPLSLEYFLSRNTMPDIDAVRAIVPYNTTEILMYMIGFRCTREFMDICHLSTREQIRICQNFEDYETLVDILSTHKIDVPTSIFMHMPLYLLKRLHKSRPDLFNFEMGKHCFQSVKCAIFCMQHGCRVGAMPYDCYYHQDPNFCTQCPIEWQCLKYPIPNDYLDWVMEKIPNDKLPDLIQILIYQHEFERLIRLGVDIDYDLIFLHYGDIRAIVAEPKTDVTNLLHFAMVHGTRVHEVLEECHTQNKHVVLNNADLVHFKNLCTVDQDALCRAFTDQICAHCNDDRFRLYKALKRLK